MTAPKVSNITSGAGRRALRSALSSAQALTGLAKAAPARIDAMHDAAKGLSGSRAADAPPSEPTNFCWDHERSVRECWDEGKRCVGEPDHRRTDPTGDAAVGGDRARADERRALRLLDNITAARAELDGIFARYAPTKIRTPGAKERTALAADNLAPLRYDPALHCRLCHEVDAPHGPGSWIVPMHRMTDVGILEDPMPLCHAHIRAIGRLRRRTTKAETEHYRDTQRWRDTQGKSA